MFLPPQALAEDGALILGERLRVEEERVVVREVLAKVGTRGKGGGCGGSSKMGLGASRLGSSGQVATCAPGWGGFVLQGASLHL